MIRDAAAIWANIDAARAVTDAVYAHVRAVQSGHAGHDGDGSCCTDLVPEVTSS